MDNLPFSNRCAVATASILSSVCASLFCHRERWSASTDAERQEPIVRASTSPIFPPGSSYQVFLSFRGEDTRKGFADHLYHALVNAGICVFRDDDNLRVGMEIDTELRRAISESKISIPILSQTYASSKWCLQELTQMIERKNNSGHIVLPILYKVEPSHVRHQRGSFGKAFDSLKEHCESKAVAEWEHALKEVTSMKVWESDKTANGHEGGLTKLVVEAVLSELKHDFQLDVPEDLVGIGHPVEEIMRFVDNSICNTVMIGIYGMGGIGKTTLAKYIYNELSKRYVYRSFIPDILENGILYSQKKLISDVLQTAEDKDMIVDGAVHIIGSRFRSKQVLILLDDVDNEDQFYNLTRERSWFGLGSKIIVTTRDKGVLDGAKFVVDKKYELEMLDPQQSLLLFCRHAFRNDSPFSEFQALSQDAVAVNGGLPLALKVIGSLLYVTRDHKEWEDTIKMLRIAPEGEVQNKLKISYDKLCVEAQEIFLDIACFFNGKDKTNPTYMWDACNFFPSRVLPLLMRRCLLKIEGDKFKMHDQLRDLGRAIIRQEDYHMLKNRSRLWDYQEVLNGLNGDEGSEKIEAIRMFPLGFGVSCKKEQFEKLPNLRMLHVGCATFEGDCQNSSFSELRWLALHNHFSSTPCEFNFNSEKLVILELEKVSISEDWTGWSSMKSLKVLKLDSCKTLRSSPDLSACTNLEILSIQWCHKLERIHPSIGRLKTLISLDLSACDGLKKLPTEVKELQELKKLVLVGTNIDEIPEWIVSLKKLETLDAYFCCQLARISSEIVNLHSLKILILRQAIISSLPEMISSLSSLQVLDVENCDQLRSIPELPSNLTTLLLTCQSITLPNLSQLDYLKELELQHCTWLQFIPDLPSGLSRLVIVGCIKLEKLPTLSSLKQLIELELLLCPKLTEIGSLDGLISLTRLTALGCPKLSRFDGLEDLKMLEYLDISLDGDDEDEVEAKFFVRLKFSELLNVSGHDSIKTPDRTQLDTLVELLIDDCMVLDGIQDLDKAKLSEVLDIGRWKSIESLVNLSCCKTVDLLRTDYRENLRGIENIQNFPSDELYRNRSKLQAAKRESRRKQSTGRFY